MSNSPLGLRLSDQGALLASSFEEGRRMGNAPSSTTRLDRSGTATRSTATAWPAGQRRSPSSRTSSSAVAPSSTTPPGSRRRPLLHQQRLRRNPLHRRHDHDGEHRRPLDQRIHRQRHQRGHRGRHQRQEHHHHEFDHPGRPVSAPTRRSQIATRNIFLPAAPTA